MLAEMVKAPEFLAKTEQVRMSVDYLDAAQTRAFVEKEAAFYSEFAAKIGIRR